LPDAIEFMHVRTRGVPRLLNQLGELALVYAYADGRKTIDADLIAQVMRDRNSGRPLPTFAAEPAAPAGVTNGGAV
jgi:hypothetical protein